MCVGGGARLNLLHCPLVRCDLSAQHPTRPGSIRPDSARSGPIRLDLGRPGPGRVTVHSVQFHPVSTLPRAASALHAGGSGEGEGAGPGPRRAGGALPFAPQLRSLPACPTLLLRFVPMCSCCFNLLIFWSRAGVSVGAHGGECSAMNLHRPIATDQRIVALLSCMKYDYKFFYQSCSCFASSCQLKPKMAKIVYSSFLFFPFNNDELTLNGV